MDRLYLNGYVPKLQTPGQLVTFLRDHPKNPIPSPALLGRITTGFKDAVEGFARKLGLGIFHFARGERKDDVAAKHRGRFKPTEGVYLMGVAQEKCTAFKSVKRLGRSPFGSDYSRQSVCVNHYHFYLVDEDFGPAFIKVGSYAPYPLKICLNGHEWLKRQLDKEGVVYEALDNGVLSC